MRNFYIGYSFIEEEKSANQIQSKNTFLNLEKIDPNIIGIFLGNKNKLLWNIRREGNKYFIDRNDILNDVVENITKTLIIRRNLFPYFFSCRCSQVLKRFKEPKNIYIRQGDINEFLFFLERLNQLSIKKIIFELHNLTFDIPNFYYWNFEKQYCYKKYLQFFNLLKNNPQRAKLVTLTKSLVDIIRDKFNYKEDIKIIPDAHNFMGEKPKDVNFNKEKIEIIYIGLTFKNRGVEMAVKTLEFLPDKFHFRFVGGHKQEREGLRKRYYSFVRQQRLILEEPVPYSKVREKLLGADIAILPTPLSEFARFTSPLKLFEYMSVGLPIVASNTPTFKEILTKNSALFFEPNNSRDLAEKVEYLAGNQKLAQKIGKNAFENSKKYTYKKRAERIYNLFENE